MCETATSGLTIPATITGGRCLTSTEILAIRAGILKQIISDASSPYQGTGRPIFNGEPLSDDNGIKLWCANVYTVKWLKETVRKLSVPSCPSLEVKEDLKRTLGKFVIPDVEFVYQGVVDIKRTLCYQNPSLDFDRLEDIHASHKEAISYWNIQINFPEDQRRVLENAGCKLYFGLSSVKVVFDN